MIEHPRRLTAALFAALFALALAALPPRARAQDDYVGDVTDDEEVITGGPTDGLDAQVPPPPGAGLDPLTTTFPGGYQMQRLRPSDRVPVGGGDPLTLGQVWTSVQRHHPQVETYRQRVLAARGELLSAEGGFDLQLYARGYMAPMGYYDYGRADIELSQPTPFWGARFYGGWRIGRGLSNPESDSGRVPPYYGQYETLDAGEVRAGVTVPLWRGGPIDSRRRDLWRAEHYVEAQEAYFAGNMLSMRYYAASAYWYWVAAGLKYRIAAALLDLAEQRDEQISARVRAGAIPPIESLENRRVIVSRRTELIEARRALERAAIDLSLFYRTAEGAPRVPRPARLPGAIDAPEEFAVQLPRAVEAAWRLRPEMERYRALIERQQVSVDYYENQFAPQIDVSFGAAADIGSGVGDEGSFSTDQETRLGPAVVEGSILFSMPLQFREARGDIRYAEAEMAQLRAQAQLARDTIATEVQQAYSALTAARERVALAREAAEVATAVAEAERRRFTLGATQLFIVNLREQSAASARKTLVEAEADLQIAQVRWEIATGEALDQVPPPPGE